MKLTNRQLANAYLALAEEQKGKKLDEIAEGFVEYLSERNELSRWKDVVRSIDYLWKEKHGLATIHVTSAHKLSEKAVSALEKIAKGAELKTDEDETLITGARIRIDDRVFDGSAKAQLKRLSSQLIS